MAPSMKASFENRDKYIALGLNVSYYRKLAGMSQDQLAEKAGISRSHIGNIESRSMVNSMSLEVLFKIANALRIPPSKLLEFRD